MVKASVSIGQYVRQVRESRGFSLRAFAQMIGKTPTFVSRFERDDDMKPSEETLRTMAGILEIDVDDLIFRANKMPADLPKIVQKHPAAIAALLRTVQNMSEKELKAITEFMRNKPEDLSSSTSNKNNLKV